RAFQPRNHVQSPRGNLQSEAITEQLLKLLDKGFSSLGVDSPHSFDVTKEKSLGDETRQSSLIDRRGVLIHCAASFHQRIDQRLWRHDVAQAQRRIKNFTHRSRVNDAAEVVDSLQARERRSGKTELCVKVVFKNKCMVSTRKIEQRCSARETHCHAEGILV